MSYIVATVTDINSCKNLNIVEFICDRQHLYMMSLELNKDITIGTKVELSLNPSHVAISIDENAKLSYQNQLKSKITDIKNGELLTIVELSIGTNKIESIITSSSLQRLALNIDDEVTALIKASELYIVRVLS